jgi:hypothetical protein
MGIDAIRTSVSGVNALDAACAPLAFNRNATIDAYVSRDRPFAFSGGIERRICVNNSRVV